MKVVCVCLLCALCRLKAVKGPSKVHVHTDLDGDNPDAVLVPVRRGQCDLVLRSRLEIAWVDGTKETVNPV